MKSRYVFSVLAEGQTPPALQRTRGPSLKIADPPPLRSSIVSHSSAEPLTEERRYSAVLIGPPRLLLLEAVPKPHKPTTR